MKTPQIAPLQGWMGASAIGLENSRIGKLPIFNHAPTDQKTIAERKWQAGLKPATAQLPPDVGLFGDSHLQLDLVEMFQDPAED